MQSSSTQTIIIFIAGTVIMILVFGFIFLFMLLYERKRQRYRATIQQLEIDNQKKLLEAVIEAQEEEKQYFAEELHDSIGQLLSVISMNLNTLKRKATQKNIVDPELDKITNITLEIAKTSIQEVRNISQKLMPVILNDFGLQASLLDLVSKTNETGAQQITLRYELNAERLAKNVEKALYRITQELLSNTIKYAKAKQVNIVLCYQGDTVLYEYEDNGVGFDIHNIKKSGVGLKSIESRVNSINGNLTVVSGKEIGTKVNITLAKI